MAEASRPRPVEYYNPRSLILGMCFVWGVVMGFCLFYFAPPKQMSETPQSGNAEPTPARTAMSELERRRLDTPNIAEVAPAPQQPLATRPRMEELVLEPPMPVLTTDGGLTGRNAPALNPQRQTAPTTTTRRPAQVTAPPPIPELMP